MEHESEDINSLREELRDLLVTHSEFPVHDELGRLICKGCGLPYRSWTLRDQLESLQDKEGATFFSTCLNCRKISLFSRDELALGRYSPVGIRKPSGRLLRKAGTIRDNKGLLKCQSCDNSFNGFTVKGTLALLNQSNEPFVWLACDKCLNTSIFSATELRLALPEAPVRILKPGETLLYFPILGVMKGGMGIVYICHSPLGLIAAKTLRPELSRLPEAEARFRREADAWIMLGSHPNIVEAKFLSLDRGQSVLVTDFQEGGNLASLMMQRKLSIDDIIKYGMHFCSGMEHARALFPNFVHRDIKPENCLIGKDDMLKVSDFGLVKVLDEIEHSEKISEDQPEPLNVFQTQLGRGGMGTLPYMAPEQYRNFSSADVRSDVYSFGVMLFQMITGRLPFLVEGKRRLPFLRKGKNRIKDWYKAHTSTPVPYVGDYRNSVPRELSDLVQTCMAKDSGDRPQHFGIILETLRSIRRIETKSGSVHMKSATNLSELQEKHESGGDDIEQLDMLRVFNLLNIGKSSMALEYADKIIMVASQSSHERSEMVEARGHALRAMVLVNMGNLKEATREADRALILNAEDPLALYQRGWLANHEGDFQTAIECLEKSFSLDPNRDRLPFELAFAYNAVGRYDQAISFLLAAIKKEPDNYINHREIGYSYLHTGKYDLAKKHYERGFALCSPSLPSERAEIAANLAQVYINTGNEKEGAEWLKQAWLIAPKGSQMHKELSKFIRRE